MTLDPREFDEDGRALCFQCGEPQSAHPDGEECVGREYARGFAAGRAAFDAVVAERDEAVKERDAAIEVCAAKIRERDAALAAGQKLSEAVLMDWATSRTPVIHGKTQQALINWRSGVLRDHDEKGTR